MIRLALVILALAPILCADTLLVLNKEDNALAFVDPATRKVGARVPTGEGSARTGDIHGRQARLCLQLRQRAESRPHHLRH